MAVRFGLAETSAKTRFLITEKMTNTEIDQTLEMLEKGCSHEAKSSLERTTSINSSLSIARYHVFKAKCLATLGIATNPSLPKAHYLLGVSRFSRGDYAGAIKAYQLAISLGIDDAAVFNNLGRALEGQERYGNAISAFQKSIEKQSDYADTHFNLAAAFQRLGRHLEASVSHKNAINIDPDYFEACFGLGLAYAEIGRHDEAVVAYHRAIELNPENAEAYCNFANSLVELNRHAEAISAYQNAIGLKPDYVAACNNLAATLKALNRPEAAITCYRNAVAANPDCAEYYYNLATTLIECECHSEGVANLEHAIRLNPNFADAYCKLGSELFGLKRYVEAVAACQKAIALTHRADYAEPYFHLAASLNAKGRREEAISYYRMAIGLKPTFAEAYNKLGGVLLQNSQYSEAIIAYEKALLLEPDMPFVQGLILHCKMLVHDWDGIEGAVQSLLANIDAGKAVATPFVIFSIPSSPAQQKRCAEILVKKKYPAIVKSPTFSVKRVQRSRIRVGYFSADFYDHPVARLTVELFEKHDRSQFEIIAFSYGLLTSGEMHTRLVDAFDHFLDVREMPDEGISGLAREMELDIAIDLTGFTGDVRTGIFANRAAPIQISYLGYLGTMGAPYMDYLIADAIVIPKEYKSFYTEKIIYMPNSFMVNGSHRNISAAPLTRCNAGLPEHGFVFCCFNNGYKITPQIFDIWMEILRQTKGTVLWLVEDNEAATQRLQNEAQKRNVKAGRLIFAKRMDLPTYLSCYQLADLFLDTLYYGAGTTGSDALWAGLPILTYPGDTFSSRIAASLLMAIGLPELVVDSREKYVSAAINLAENPERITAIKARLLRNRSTRPLFDTALFTRQLESALKQLLICNHDS